MKKDVLNVGLFQYDIAWENPLGNMLKIDKYLSKVDNIDLLILPEMFTTGFSMDVDNNAESMKGESIQWLKNSAERYEMVIIGSLVIKIKEQYFNRCVVVHANGDIVHYDKKHLFTYGKEDQYFTAGTEKLLIDVKGWKLCPLICYDLRFPVWSRNSNDYDVLLFIANWPTPRSSAWNALLKARAIENQAYVIGVNRIGIDENKLEYQGDSQLIDYSGEINNHLGNNEMLEIVELNMEDLNNYRDKFKFLQDRDMFTINP